MHTHTAYTHRSHTHTYYMYTPHRHTHVHTHTPYTHTGRPEKLFLVSVKDGSCSNVKRVDAFTSKGQRQAGKES